MQLSSVALKAGIVSLTVFSSVLLYLLYKKQTEQDNQRATQIETSRQTIIEIKIPREYVTMIIGRAGSKVKEIQKDTQTQIHFQDDSNVDLPERVCVIRGKPENVRLAEGVMRCIIANQPLIETYETYIPNKLTGALIGRGGQNIMKIQQSTNSKIMVDSGMSSRDPNAQRRLIIKGTAEQITNALNEIEDRIRELNEAQEKLESNVFLQSPRGKSPSKSPSVELNNGTEPQVPIAPVNTPPSTEESISVYVSAMETPSKFWVQLLGPSVSELDELISKMTEYYENEENKELHKLKDVTAGQMVAAKFSADDKWYRAKILTPFIDKKYDVFFTDFGDHQMVEGTDILEIRTDFLILRPQAVECSLANVAPKDHESWLEAALDKFEELVHLAQWKALSAKIKGYKKRAAANPLLKSSENENSVLELDLLTTVENKGEVDVATELINEGFAKRDEESKLNNSTDSPLKLDY